MCLICPSQKILCRWPCKAYEINTVGMSIHDLTMEDFLVIATKRKGHYRVVPRKDNKVNFWKNVFELRNFGNLSSRTLKNFKYSQKTFYDAISCNNFDFSDEIERKGSAEEIQIFTEISEI